MKRLLTLALFLLLVRPSLAQGVFGTGQGAGYLPTNNPNFTGLLSGPSAAFNAATVNSKQICLLDGTNCPAAAGSLPITNPSFFGNLTGPACTGTAGSYCGVPNAFLPGNVIDARYVAGVDCTGATDTGFLDLDGF